MSRFRLFDLNPAQETAVRTTEGPVLILAGAGTGKTRVITARAAYLLSQGVEPSNILAVTFTNKAANEMRQRLARMVESDQAKGVLMSTFHALCVRILRRDIEKLGYKRNFSIYDEGDQLGVIRKIITRTAARDEKLDPAVARNVISKAKNAGHTKARGEETLIGAVFDRYQAELKTLNAVDFDDLLLLTVKLLNEHDDVKARWSNRFAYIMVDEFQDTNHLQLELVSLLAVPETVHGLDNASRSPNVCVVGDDDQSIYGWRGAEVSNILEFERHFPNPAIIKLEENYRSTNAILKTANALIKNNPRRRPKQLWSARGDGAKVRIIQMPDDPQEASFIANDIARRQLCEGTPWEKFAVLFRTNAQSRLIEQNLRTLRIPYRIIGGKSFFEAREVKDFLAYASCLLNTDDDVSLLRIINTPARGIGPSVVERAMAISIAQKKSFFAALQLPAFRAELSSRQSAQIDGFIRMLDEYETRLHEPLANQSAVLREFISTTGYMEDLGRSCKTPEETLKRQLSIHELLRWFDEHAQRSNSGLRGFLDEMLLRHEEEEEQSDDGSGVTLITLHAAKGLEFPHVYLIGLEEGMLPHERSRAEGTLDEERRLLYVGITRAMDALTLTWCRSRIRYGSATPRMPSSFIKELPADSVTHAELSQILNAPMEEARVKSGFGSILASLGHES